MSSLPRRLPEAPSPAVRPQPRPSRVAKPKGDMSRSQIPGRGWLEVRSSSYPLFMRHILLGGPGSPGVLPALHVVMGWEGAWTEGC